MELEMILRLLALLVIGSTLVISGLYRRQARKDTDQIQRGEEGGLALGLRLAAALPLLADILLNIFAPRLMDWSKLSLPIWLQALGAVASLLCVPWLWWVFRTIGVNISETVLTKAGQQLVTRGPYGRIRHPLYAGALLLLLSFGLMFADWVLLVFFIGGLLGFRLLVIPAEEDQLLQAFGEEYECYQSQTGALLPWIR